MLRRISIENFKAVGERVDINLKPVTLLFGPNSVGKSTILHAIHYAHAILESGDPEVGRTRLGGEIDLGGFHNLVHNHDLHAGVMLGFEFEPDSEGALRLSMDYFAEDIKTVRVELQVRWSRYLDRPIVERYGVGINGEQLIDVECSIDGANVQLTNRNPENPVLMGQAGAELFPDEPSGRLRGRKSALPRFDDDNFVPFHMLTNRLAEHLYEVNIPIEGQMQMVLAELRSRFSQLEEHLAPLALEELVVGAGKALRQQLARFRYVGPLRDAPPRQFMPPKRDNEARWATGLAAWDLLASNNDIRQEVSQWLSDTERLNTGYRIELYQFEEGDLADLQEWVKDAVNIWVDDRIPFLAYAAANDEKRLILIETDSDLVLAPCDVGQGIVQVVPVITAALAGLVRTGSHTEEPVELVAIEQPELHTHPRMQTVLADLFLSNCGERQFLIETHSEHLMLRLLRRIRETTENELPPDATPATTETVAVLYVERGEEGVSVSELRISEDGDFLDSWPQGFFPERLEEFI